MATTWYRRSLFNYKGNREYTRTGYEAAATRFVDEDMDVDCSDRHYMITGSNSGIGLETALEVARRGGIIHMVCRNKDSATQARSQIITTTGNDKIYLHIVDLGRPREVIVWAQKFAAQHENLHVLIHNAGCMVHQRTIDEDGVEFNFAVNTLAVHILTLTFMPLLQRSDDARVVTVSSAGLLTVRLDPHDLMHTNLDPFNGRLAYSQHKRQQVVMTLWYAQHYNKVHFSSMHPGWADTNAVRTSIPEFYEMMKDNLRSPSQGADTVVWLAISKAALKYPGGLFFQDREPVSTHLPLAWTKSTIEEDDFLLTNIQKVYSEIYNKIYNPDGTPNNNDTPAPSSTQHQEPAGTEKQQDEENSTEGREDINKQEKSDAETTPFPVLPPPPPPADRGVKSEVLKIEIEKQTAPETEGNMDATKLNETEENMNATKLNETEGNRNATKLNETRYETEEDRKTTKLNETNGNRDTTKLNETKGETEDQEALEPKLEHNSSSSESGPKHTSSTDPTESKADTDGTQMSGNVESEGKEGSEESGNSSSQDTQEETKDKSETPKQILPEP